MKRIVCEKCIVSTFGNKEGKIFCEKCGGNKVSFLSSKEFKIKHIQFLITEIRREFAAGNLSVNAYSSEINRLKKALKEVK